MVSAGDRLRPIPALPVSAVWAGYAAGMGNGGMGTLPILFTPLRLDVCWYTTGLSG